MSWKARYMTYGTQKKLYKAYVIHEFNIHCSDHRLEANGEQGMRKGGNTWCLAVLTYPH